MPSFVEIGPPVSEKILENSAMRLYDLRIPNKTPIANAYNAVHNTIHVSYKQVYGFNRRQLAIETPFLTVLVRVCGLRLLHIQYDFL